MDTSFWWGFLSSSVLWFSVFLVKRQRTRVRVIKGRPNLKVVD